MVQSEEALVVVCKLDSWSEFPPRSTKPFIPFLFVKFGAVSRYSRDCKLKWSISVRSIVTSEIWRR